MSRIFGILIVCFILTYERLRYMLCLYLDFRATEDPIELLSFIKPLILAWFIWRETIGLQVVGAVTNRTSFSTRERAVTDRTHVSRNL